MSTPHILVDADACPVVRQVEAAARRHEIPMTLLCDEHHIMYSDYAQVRHVSSGRARMPSTSPVSATRTTTST